METGIKNFIIENVRCFRERLRVPLRPITFLVGENSTGKTTFLGCYRALRGLFSLRNSLSNEIWDFFDPDENAKNPNIRGHGYLFNQDPFLMGAFADIVSRLRSSAASFRLGFGFSQSGNPELICSFSDAESAPNLSAVSSILPNGEELCIDIASDGIRIRGAKVNHRFSGEAHGMLEHYFRSPAFLLGGAHGQYLKKRDISAPQGVKNALDRHFPSMQKMGLSLPFGLVSAIAPIRSKPQRIYPALSGHSTPEGDHIPALLARLSREEKKEWGLLREQLVKFGKDSQLFSGIDIRPLGRKSGASFELQIKALGGKSNIMDVGYGISQILPVLVNPIRSKQMSILLQQPEVHLHPQAQAALANLFAALTKPPRGHSFIIETHSDFIVNRMRVCVRKGEIAARDVVILYFAPDKRGGGVKIHPIELDDGGQIQNPPRGYRDFFTQETRKVLGFSD